MKKISPLKKILLGLIITYSLITGGNFLHYRIESSRAFKESQKFYSMDIGQEWKDYAESTLEKSKSLENLCPWGSIKNLSNKPAKSKGLESISGYFSSKNSYHVIMTKQNL